MANVELSKTIEVLAILGIIAKSSELLILIVTWNYSDAKFRIGRSSNT